MSPLFQPMQKILFIGDSVSDCGRRIEYPPLGNGYIHWIDTWLQGVHPELNLQVVNKGFNGHTTCDLMDRWEVDVIAEQPDWLIIEIGANDATHPYYHRDPSGVPLRGVPLKEFCRNYRQLVDRALSATHCRLIFMLPALIEPDRQDPVRKVVQRYQQAVKSMSREYQVPVFNPQRFYDRGMKFRPASFWSPDRFHPTEMGHALLGYQFLRLCGF
jgi:lysophospholipase L1-like esterase